MQVQILPLPESLDNTKGRSCFLLFPHPQELPLTVSPTPAQLNFTTKFCWTKPGCSSEMKMALTGASAWEVKSLCALQEWGGFMGLWAIFGMTQS